MNSKHADTLAAVLTKPTLANIKWSAIEGLLLALGATLREGQGSRVSFVLDGRIFSAHRPHPGKEAKKYQVEALRIFLAERPE